MQEGGQWKEGKGMKDTNTSLKATTLRCVQIRPGRHEAFQIETITTFLHPLWDFYSVNVYKIAQRINTHFLRTDLVVVAAL